MNRKQKYTVNEGKNELGTEQEMVPMNESITHPSPPNHYGDTPGRAEKQESENLLSKPVTLSPSWEEQNKPEEELNFKTVVVTGPEPRDRFYIVYIIMLLHGIGVLMPWNMFITAQAYFTEYKLATEASEESEYQKNFVSYLGICSQLPNVLLNLINLFVQFGGNPRVRIPWAIAVIAIIFIITTALAMIDSSEWPGIFFGITMASVVIMNSATGVYQNSVYGMAGPLPMKYTGAVVLGNNVSGTLTSIINILAIALAPDPQSSAIWYFIAALVILLVCFDTYFALPLLRFFRFWEKQAQIGKDGSKSSGLPPYWQIFKKVWVQCFNIFFIFFVTLTVFPAMQVKVEKLDENFIINDTYFQPVICFLFFNVFAMIGNAIASLVKFMGPKYLWIPCVLRALFIPAVMFCNYFPDIRGSLPVFISNDYAYAAISFLHGITSGYFSSLVMMYTPGLVEPQYAGVAGMMAAFFLVLGIFAGVNFSLVMAKLVEAIGK